MALSPNKDIIEALPWAKGEITCDTPALCGDGKIDVYVGLMAYSIDVRNPGFPNATSKVVKWGDTTCDKDLTQSAEQTFCSTCDSAAAGAVTTVITSLITSFLGMKSDIQRLRRKNDHNCAKTLSIITGILGTSMQLAALSTFQAGCVNSFPETTIIKYKWALGVGWIALCVACVLKLIIVAIHITIPTPPPRWKKEYDESEDPAAGEWPKEEISI